MENKRTMEYCTPTVKEIALDIQGVICESGFGEEGAAGAKGTFVNDQNVY